MLEQPPWCKIGFGESQVCDGAHRLLVTAVTAGHLGQKRVVSIVRQALATNDDVPDLPQTRRATDYMAGSKRGDLSVIRYEGPKDGPGESPITVN